MYIRHWILLVILLKIMYSINTGHDTCVLVIFKRPVFSLGVSQHVHTITNLWKFELNKLEIGRRMCEIIMKEKTPLSHEVVCFISRPRDLILRSRNQIRGKLFLSRKLLQRKPFLTMFILTAPHYSFPSTFYANN